MFINILFTGILRGSRGRDRMVAGLTTTHAICAFTSPVKSTGDVNSLLVNSSFHNVLV
jgi:hypothetical protein